MGVSVVMSALAAIPEVNARHGYRGGTETGPKSGVGFSDST